MARHIQDIIEELDQRVDEPEAVRTLVFELRAALSGDIHAQLLMLEEACQRGNSAEMGMILRDVEENISPHLTGFDPNHREINENRWRNMREVLRNSVEMGQVGPLDAEYVHLFASMVRTEWRMDGDRWCLCKLLTCPECKWRFHDSKAPGHCDVCGTPRRLCRSKTEPGLAACFRHDRTLTKANGAYRHPTSSLYSFKGKRFKEIFEAAIGSEDMLSNRDNIALFMARMQQMVDAWEESEGEDVIYSMRRIRTLKVALEMALEEGDEDRITRLGQAILRAVEVIDSDRRYWEDMRNTTELLRRLRDSERQRIIQAHNTLTVEEAMSMMEVLVGLLIEGIDQYVPGKMERERLLGYMNRVLVSQNTNRALPSTQQ